MYKFCIYLDIDGLNCIVNVGWIGFEAQPDVSLFCLSTLGVLNGNSSLFHLSLGSDNKCPQLSSLHLSARVLPSCSLRQDHHSS